MNNNIPTPHNCAKKNDFAKTVIMPGDPLRSKYIAENFLTDAKLVNDVRGVQGYTGYYKGKKVSVMAHGMGMSSMHIYAYELYKFYDVKNIIRVGSCGGLNKDMHIKDVVVAKWAMTPSNIGERIYKNLKRVDASEKLLNTATKVVEKLNVNAHFSGVLTYDVFDLYGKPADKKYKKQCDAVEMEVYALYLTAKQMDKNALAFLTVSDNSLYDEVISAEDRQTALNEMITCALETAIKL